MSDPQYGNVVDREYDGIRVSDHPPPGWWVGLFWLTIAFSGCYWLYYQWGSGPSVHDEYDAEALAYFEEQAFLYGDMEISNQTIAAFLDRPDDLERGRTLFLEHCQSCHTATGGGDIGPNLTDEYWLHGGELEDIYSTINDGVPGQGMQAWKTRLNPLFIMWLTAYVHSLEGSSPPNARAPQGQKFVPSVPPEPTGTRAGGTGATGKQDR